MYQKRGRVLNPILPGREGDIPFIFERNKQIYLEFLQSVCGFMPMLKIYKENIFEHPFRLKSLPTLRNIRAARFSTIYFGQLQAFSHFTWW